MPLCSQLFQCEEKSGGPVQTDVLHKESSHSHGLATTGVGLQAPAGPSTWPPPGTAESVPFFPLHAVAPVHTSITGPQECAQPYNPLFSERPSLRQNLNKPHPCSKPFQGSPWTAEKTRSFLCLPQALSTFQPRPPSPPGHRLPGLLQHACPQPFLLSALGPFLFTHRTSLTTMESRCAGYFQSFLNNTSRFEITQLVFSLLPPPHTHTGMYTL